MCADSSIFQYSIYKRSDSKNWQVQFRDASGHLVQRGTGTSNKLKACQVAADWRANGLPAPEPSILRPLADVFSAESTIEAALFFPPGSGRGFIPRSDPRDPRRLSACLA
jgi:hypothetical protein